MFLTIDEMKVPMGNFPFIYQKTQNTALFDTFLEAESHLKLNYVDFAHKLRMAFEMFALEEYISNRSQTDSSSISQIREEIVNEIKAPASTTNYKSIIISLCKGREIEFVDILVKYHFLKFASNEIDLVKRTLAKLIRSIYAFGSENSHEGSDKQVTYSDCLNAINVFHDFLIVYYHAPSKTYDHKLAPVGEYITIPKLYAEKIGLALDQGKTLHIRVRQGQPRYYVLSQETAQISKPQRRDIEVIEKLWEDNVDDPANVIRQTDVIHGAEPEILYRVYSLPSKPLRINSELVSTLSIGDKTDIIRGLCKGVASIHNFVPALYHRHICPDAFYVFKIKGKYKALLSKFEYTKDTSSEAAFTVFKNLENSIRDTKDDTFFAPEVKLASVNSTIDWEKADIYSLAKTCLFILSGKNLSVDEYSQTIDDIPFSDTAKLALIEMLDGNAQNRPGIETLIQSLSIDT